MVRDCVPRAIEKQIDLGYEGTEPGAAGGQIEGNPTLLKELVRNLLDNALRYSPPGKSVFVRIDENDSELSVKFRIRNVELWPAP